MTLAFGQTPTISLSESIALAQVQSTTAKQARSAYKQATWDYEMYRANLKPSLALSVTPARYVSNIVQRYNSEQNQDVYRRQQSYLATSRLTLTQPVTFTGGTLQVYSDLNYYRTFGLAYQTQYASSPIVVSYKQQLLGYNPYKWMKHIEQKRLRMAQQQLAHSLTIVALQTANLYTDALVAQKHMELLQEQITNNDTLLAKALILEQLGRLNTSDVLTLRLELSKTRTQHLEAQQTLHKLLWQLCDYIGLPHDSHVQLAALDTPPLPNLSVQEVIQHTLATHPQVLQHIIRTTAAQQAVDKAQKQRWIDPSLELSLGFNQSGNSLPLAYQNLLRQDIVSVTISIPIIDWGVRKRQLYKAKETLKVAHLAVDEAAQKLHQDIATLMQEIPLRLQVLHLYKTNIALAQQLQQESQERFLLGKTRLEELLRANQSLHETEQSYLQTLKRCWQNHYTLQTYLLHTSHD
ncbi:MAG: TolC family protein [Bacteroidales bacterium]|nr:TolC family protein [Bacteroidales bacterium]